MKPLIRSTSFVVLIVASAAAQARGVSPYLPLNMAPEIERQIERVLILGGRPVVRRPIPAAQVMDALPAACEIDRALCSEVRAYLDLFIRDRGVTLLRPELAIASGDSDRPLPNAHGRLADSAWQVAASAFFQPSDYLLLNVGGVAHEDRATPTGTMLSVGYEYAQFDIGFRDHWLSPASGSALLISTEAPTLLAATLSNYTPISPLGITYEVFASRLSRQENIRFLDQLAGGEPRLAGLQLGIEPAKGYALTLNRLMQYGGGPRSGSGFSGLWEALTDREAANEPDVPQAEEFGNQIASVAATLTVPANVPFAVQIEYAGEDSSYGGNYRFGDTAITLGLDFPLVADAFDVNVEFTEWQNAWYVHHLYPLGMTNDGFVLGHWFGDQRLTGDRVGGWSAVLQAGYRSSRGDYWRARYRTLDFVTSLGFQSVPEYPYEQLHELALEYTTQWQGFPVNAGLSAGRDALGDSYTRLTGSIDFAMTRVARRSLAPAAPRTVTGVEIHAKLGATYGRVFQILSAATPDSWTSEQASLYAGIGVRRQVTNRNDIGVGLELDRIDDEWLVSLRAVDYRFRLTPSFALTGFLGVGRYDWGAPAHGWYMGAGLQWRDLLPGWDVGLEARYYDKLSRNRVAPGDPAPVIERPRIHFDVEALTLSLTRKF